MQFLNDYQGLISLLAIIASILIFRRQFFQRFYNMERDNFDELYKDIIMKQLPEMLEKLARSKSEEWNSSIDDLITVLDTLLSNSKYYRYALPSFYNRLSYAISDVCDLARTEYWSLYRTRAKQNRLIQNKCKKIIRLINNTYKGKNSYYSLKGTSLYKRLRNYFIRKFIVHPADRIVATYVEDGLDGFEFYSNGSDTLVDIVDLKNLVSSELTVKALNNYTIINIYCTSGHEQFYFWYKWNFRWGREKGVPILKAKSIKSGKVDPSKSVARITWNDKSIYKIIILWTESDDNNHIHFCHFNVRRKP